MVPKVSHESIDAYEREGNALIDRVNRRIVDDPDCDRLIGGNPLEVMYTNHRNHHLMVTNVLRLNAWSMLEKTVPWVYASYRAQGFSEDYFPAVFDAWRVAMDERLQPEQALELRGLYDWFDARHEQNVEMAEQRAAASPLENGQSDPELEGVVNMLVAGDANGLVRLGNERIGSPRELIDFYLNLLCPALHHVGWLWERGEISVAHEHLATGVVNRLMAYWYFHVLEQPGTRGKAVVTAGPNEFHAVGSAMLADALAVDGWEVIHLGANTPAEELVVLLGEHQSELLFISVTMPFNIHYAKKTIERVRSIPAGRRCRIMIGGQAFSTSPEIWKSTGADSFASSAQSGLEKARTLSKGV